MDEKQNLPPVDFITFLISLAGSAHMAFEKNLSQAKQTIDLLDILKEKTKGNLTKEEEDLFEHLLYELRMKYVEECKKPATKTSAGEEAK